MPQGTISEPILFIMYVNELHSLQSDGFIIGSADDTVILYTADT